MPAVARLIPAERKSIRDQSMIRSMEDLLSALRERRDQLGISLETLDHIAGFPPSYSAKLLAPVPFKNLGWMSFGLALDALGVALILVENPAQVRLVERRWIPRQRPRDPAPAARTEPQLSSRK